MGGDLIMQLAGLGVRPLTMLLINGSDAPLADPLTPEGFQNALRVQAGAQRLPMPGESESSSLSGCAVD